MTDKNTVLTYDIIELTQDEHAITDIFMGGHYRHVCIPKVTKEERKRVEEYIKLLGRRPLRWNDYKDWEELKKMTFCVRLYSNDPIKAYEAFKQNIEKTTSIYNSYIRQNINTIKSEDRFTSNEQGEKVPSPKYQSLTDAATDYASRIVRLFEIYKAIDYVDASNPVEA